MDNATTDDIWDDTLVMKTWDESMRLAKEDVAKRLASSTNSIARGGVTQDAKVDTSAGERKLDWEPVSSKFKPGDFCRATYKADGVDYEAVLVSVAENQQDRCLIKFLGYGNEQYCQMRELVASWGEEFRMDQIDAATQDMDVSADDIDSNASTLNSDRESTSQVDPGRTRKGNNKKRRAHNVCAPPIPPMPPTFTGQDNDGLHAMLMSWYMSGYYTGVYDAQQKLKRK